MNLLEFHAEELINKTVDLALDGDIQALRFCLERLIPKASSQHIQLELQEFNTGLNDDLSSIGKKIIDAISNGAISLESGNQLMGILDFQRKLIEHIDMSRKLEEIIQAQNLT